MKRRKINEPFGAHSNTASAVVFEVFALWITTATLCVKPRHVFRRVSSAVFCVDGSIDLFSQAAATFNTAVFQASQVDNDSVAAHALTPHAPTLAHDRWYFFDWRQARERNAHDAGQWQAWFHDVLSGAPFYLGERLSWL
jgi:hypothetical protein